MLLSIESGTGRKTARPASRAASAKAIESRDVTIRATIGMAYEETPARDRDPQKIVVAPA
jgi:hypothetical protein